ncbi:MAG TPA: hypothetical protein VIY48_19340 [Candidatus Paceibacterota bacterium]
MSNWGFDDNDNAGQGNDSASNGPKALRDAYTKLQEQNKALADSLATIQADLRTTKVAGVFESLGVPAAASLYQGDADPTKIQEWVTTMKTAFGSQGAPVPNPVEATSPLTGDAAAQFQRMNEAGQSGTPLGSMELAQAAVNDATDIQGLINNFTRLNM